MRRSAGVSLLWLGYSIAAFVDGPGFWFCIIPYAFLVSLLTIGAASQGTR